jgi:two-component system, OmpR family, response regulator
MAYSEFIHLGRRAAPSGPGTDFFLRQVMRILVVEDERKIALFVQKGLKECGFAVDMVHHGDQALEILLENHFDAVVLDIMLPGRDGLSILRALREKFNAVPILILTARGEVSEKVEGLDLGADDYLAKPFSIDELAARLRALIRRKSGENLVRYRVQDLSLDLATRVARRGTRRIDLTTREFGLLECLMRTPGRVFSRTQLCQHVWEYQFDPESNLVDVYIQRLRRKIDDGEPSKLIQTVRGAGYRIGDAT